MGAKVGLSKAAVVAASGALADAVGLDGVTLTALAAALKIRTPTLYHYVAGLPGLRRELALVGLREQEEWLGRAVMGRSGAEAIRALAGTLRAYIKAHPGIYAATVRSDAGTDPDVAVAQRAVVEIALRALATYRLTPDDAIHTVRMVRAVVHGFATLELAGGFGLPQEVDETFHRLIETYIGALEASARQSTYPTRSV